MFVSGVKTSIGFAIVAFSAKIAFADTNAPVTNEKVALATPRTPQIMATSGETRYITIVMVGDTGYAPHRAVPKYNGVSKHGRWLTFEQTTKNIAAHIDGDINFANIESVITDKRLRAVPKAFNFAMHSKGAKHLVKTGFNLFSLANNHSFDHGAKGIRESLYHSNELLDHGLLAHAGIGLNNRQAARTPIFSVKNTRFAFGAIGIGAGGGGIQRASDKRAGQLNINSKKDLKSLAHNLRAADASFRLLSIHRGLERYVRPSKGEVASVRRLVDAADADIMIGHHAHVTRGIEMRGDKLIIYGLGNFLHHGTANMGGKNGCLDYSIIAKVHLVAHGSNKPKIAAIEITPITQTHMQTRPLKPQSAAKRIAVLNGLASQFDSKRNGSKGIRFAVRADGTGLHCLPAAQANPATRKLCAGYSSTHLVSTKIYRRALATCGRINPRPLLAAWKPSRTTEIEEKTVATKIAKIPMQTPKAKLKASLRGSLTQSVTQPQKLKRNPSDWPAGIPLAWEVPENETYAQKRLRWAKKRYSIAEVEKLLLKRGLITR